MLACKGTDEISCLTAPQVDAVRRVYAGASNPRTGEKIFPGLERGSELGWSPVPVGYAVDYFKHIVFKDPNWDPKTLNFDSHLAEAYPAAHQIFDANDPKLGAFVGRGGRLIMYQGWGEPGIPPGNVVTYLGKVQAQTTGARDAVRLFMVPGMGHCGGGNGTSTFDMVAALDGWVDGGRAPEQIAASRVRDGQGGPHAAAVRLAEAGHLQRLRQRGRRRQLRVQVSPGAWSLGRGLVPVISKLQRHAEIGFAQQPHDVLQFVPRG